MPVDSSDASVTRKVQLEAKYPSPSTNLIIHSALLSHAQADLLVPMSAPTPPPNPLIRQSNPAPTGAAAAAPPVSPSPTAQPRRKVTPERRAFSWSRPFRFALQPKILFFGILPAGLALSFFDPLGLYVKVERGLDKRVGGGPTMEAAQQIRRAGRGQNPVPVDHDKPAVA